MKMFGNARALLLGGLGSLMAGVLLTVPTRVQAQALCQEDPTMCVPPTLAFQPATGASYLGTATTYALQVTIRWCSNSALQSSTRQIRFRGSIVTSQFTYTAGTVAGCDGYGATSVGTVQLQPGSNTLTGNITNADGIDGAGSAVYTYTQQGAGLPPFAVAVTPDGGTQRVSDSLPAATSFIVTNVGSQAATYAISATCSGAGTIGCAPTQTSVSLPLGESATVGVTFRAGAVGATSTILLKAWKADATTVRDSGSVAVTVANEPQAGSVGDPDMQPIIARGLCLTAGAGEAAAYQCGDLRLAHGLPATRVLNRAISPTLLYNSQNGRPTPTVGMTVAPPAGTTPDSIIATLTLNATTGGTTVARGAWAGWAGGQSRRITLGFDGASYITGVYDVTLTVQTKTSGAVSALTSKTGRIIVVNRGASPFGRGWWIAGVEQLIPRTDGSLLWIGGDGSAKLYTATGQTGRWVAPSLTRPDTLKADVFPNLGGWVRELPGSARVVFDPQGRHLRTVNALGHRSEFAWSGEKLTKILLPQGDNFNTGYEYSFEYTTGNRLLRVVAPYAETPGDRITTIATDAVGQITSITDPDSSVVGFQPDATLSGLIRRRIDRMGVPVDYTFDGYSRLTKVEIDRDSTPGIATVFLPQETLGRPLTPARPSASVLTVIDGPRTESDVTQFRLDRFGAPVQVTDALGRTTSVVRGDERFPALVTYSRGPTGIEQSATYDARGRLVASTDWTRVAGVATTFYAWDDTWDAVTLVTSPTGITTRTAYDPATGQRLWQQAGQDSARRVRFTYRPRTDPTAPGLLETVHLSAAAGRGEAPQRIEYDARGNLRLTVSPLGIRDSAASDRIGRDTASSSTANPRTRTWYNASSRVRSTVVTAGSGTALQRVTVDQTYDRNGRVLTNTRTMDPDSNLIGQMRITNVYDRVGRMVRSLDPANQPATFEYDKSGNVTAHTSRRGHRTTTVYDVLGRPTRRITPEVRYASAYPVVQYGRTWSYPRHKLDPDATAADSLLIAGDTATFTYDALGAVLTADNRDARITRTYHADGSLATETQRLRTYSGTDFTIHAYTLRYGYDLEGRQRMLRHPSQLAVVGQDSATYRFDHVGQIAEVIDPTGNVFTYQWDMDGRLHRVLQPGGVTETSFYDADGRRTADSVTVSNAFVGTADGFGSSNVFSDSIGYDARSKIIRVEGQFPSASEYDGMGALTRWSAPFSESDGGTKVSLTDPLANAVWEDSRGWTVSGNQETSYHTVTRWEYSAHTGRQLAKIVTDAQRDVVRSIERNWYDASGNRQEWGSSATLALDETMHERTRAYYDAAERLRVVDRQRCMTKVVGGVPVCAGWNYQRNAEKGAFEEYRYDALGRRVLVRRRLVIVNDTELTETCTACWNTVDRFIWNGDNILWEVRANGATAPESDAEVGLNLGQVGYTHALGLDQPISILRRGYASLAPITLIPHTDYRGVLAAAHYPSGRAVENGLDVRSLPWAGANNNAYMAKLLPSQPDKWIGSLAENLADASGQLYRRNRYYDPQSGRFTQEDPIGIAGGLNLYAFGSGDPVSFTDPLGLCAKGDAMCTFVVNWLRQQRGAEFQAAAEAFDKTTMRVYIVGGDHEALGNRDGSNANRDGDASTWTGGRVVRDGSAPGVYLNGEFGKGDFLLTAVHESYHVRGHQHDYAAGDDGRIFHEAEWRAYQQMSASDRAHAPRHANRFNNWWPRLQPSTFPVHELSSWVSY